jgi:hypothetical protein
MSIIEASPKVTNCLREAYARKQSVQRDEVAAFCVARHTLEMAVNEAHAKRRVSLRAACVHRAR